MPLHLEGCLELSHAGYFDPKGEWSAVLAGGQQSRTSAWPEYLKKKMESSPLEMLTCAAPNAVRCKYRDGEVAREEDAEEWTGQTRWLNDWRK